MSADLTSHSGLSDVTMSPISAEKGGLCPRISNDTQPRGGCQDTCKYDSQCDGNSKCCFNGCAYVCLRPRKPDCEQIKCKVGYKCSEDRAGNPTCSPIRE